MLKIKTCPNCGKTNLNYDGQKMHCPDCDFTFYNNTAAAVAVLIRSEDELFFTVRNKNPQKGRLDLSGGFVDFNETAKEACARELHEELDIVIDESRLKYLVGLPNIYVYKEIEYHTLDMFFEYRVTEKFKVKLEEDEVADYQWIKLKDFNPEQLAFVSQKRFFKDYFKA